MALLGFELLFSSVRQQLRSADDAAIVAVHWNLVSNGLKCCGVGETWPEKQNQNLSGSEALPEGWNSDTSIYTLRYVDPTSNRTYLMKALAMDGTLIVHLVRCFDERTESTTIKARDFVNDDMSEVNRAYSNLSTLNNTLTEDVYRKVVVGATGQSSSQSTSGTRNQEPARRPDRPERSPLMEDPRRGPGGGGGVGFIPPRHPMRPDVDDPFRVGGADLDPLGRGGGMFMDPRGFPGAGGIGGPPGGPFRPGAPGFPPGSIPPGARFDPIGPHGVRPGPDPDHERPPDNYDDMFM